MFVARYLKLIASVIVAAVLMMAVVVPMVYNQSMETTTIENEGAGWARFAYNPSGDYSESFTTDGSNITIGTQTGTASDMIVYATDVFAIIHADSSFYLIAPGDNSADLGASAGVASASGVITVTDSSDNAAYSTDAATWAYVPDAAGDFGFFDNVGATVRDFPVAAAGSFGGLNTYNDYFSIDNTGLSFNSTVTDETFTAANWSKTSGNDSVITVKSRTINAAVDPSTGTLIGDLYYTFSGTDARVVGISSSISSATSITIPDTVTDNGTTYNVTRIGQECFKNLSSLETVILSNNLTRLDSQAFANCTNLGEITLPDSISYIGERCFDSCNNLSLTKLPGSLTKIQDYTFRSCTNLALTSLNNVTYLGAGAFDGCTNLALTGIDGVTVLDNYCFRNCTNLAITTLPDSVTLIGISAFDGCTGITELTVLCSPILIDTNALRMSNVSEILNLGTVEINAGDYGLPATVEIRDDVPLMGYVAPASFSEQTPREGVLYDVLALLPVMILVGVMMGVVALFLANRRA